MKKLFLKSNQLSNISNNLILNQETIKPDSNKSISEKSDLNSSFLQNKNNITIDYPKNYPHSFVKSPLELPRIQNQKKAININNSKLSGIKRIMISNSSTNVYSQNMLGLQNNNDKKSLKKDKTQINLIKGEYDNNNLINENVNMNNNNNANDDINYINNLKKDYDIGLFKRKLKNSNNINNITNINIHIYSNENQLNNDSIQRNTANTNKIKNINITSRDAINKPLNNLPSNNKNFFNYNSSTIETISNINRNIIYNQNNQNNLLFPRNNNFNIRVQKRKKTGQNQKNQRNGHSSSVEGNKNTTLAVVGNIIMNNSKLNLMNGNNRSISKENENTYRNKISNNSLPEINLTQIDAINKKLYQDKKNFSVSSRNKALNEILEEYEEINMNDLEKINNNSKFLIDLSNDNNDFISFLKIFQINLDIELLLNCININSNSGYNNKNNDSNSPLRQKMQLYISNDKQYKLFSLLNNYFNILNEIYNSYMLQKKSKLTNEQNDLCFFELPILNNILKNSLKTQICLYSSILISITQLAIFDFNLILKNYFLKIFKEISFSLYNIFDTFIKPELENEYNSIIKTNLRNDFIENYDKIIKDHKARDNKNNEIIKIIISNIEKSINSLKFYSSSNLKYSLIKPYGDSLNQLLFSFDRKTLFQFIDIFLNTILYGELELNKKKMFQNNDNHNSNNNINNNNINTNDCGSSIINNIKENPPYLPAINPKYKFTLVLDIDETMIHFFFTYINGMFFVRPHIFEFLSEINKYYEIVTFTAGTKEYADNILNLLDINNNLIKYRLYRQHTTIMGCNVFKDLTKLGRDLNRIIIIDNLKDNFKLNPNNGLFIKTWTSDVNDSQFNDLEKILKDIVLMDVKDVRPVIEKINDDIKISRNIINPYENIDIKKILIALNINK